MTMLSQITASGGGAIPTYIEDVFSTWLYTGTGAAQTITNNIDLSTKGGLVWTKSRNNIQNHIVTDTNRGAGKQLIPNLTLFEQSEPTALTSFNTNGFSLGSKSDVNDAANTYASWTFRKQPKFFDVVTYTGTGLNRTIAHNLGSVPGCIIVKRTDTTADWQVYHQSLANTSYLVLNTTALEATGTTRWNSTTPTSTVFSVGTDATVNASGGTYVAYIFASDAGDFGLTGTDNVISCGSFTGDGTTDYSKNISLGYEPQWVMVKRTSTTGGWFMLDTMRGWNMSDIDNYLSANLSNAETDTPLSQPNATGFAVGGTSNLNASGHTYIYIAIRRGPMKVPTDATKVFAPVTRTGTGAAATVTGVGFTPDFLWSKARNTGGALGVHDRLRGTLNELLTNSTAVEYNDPTSVLSINMDGYSFGTDASGTGTVNRSGSNYVYWNFKRAPSFFDEVCYTGTGSATTQTHNLGAVPELMIVKKRSAAGTDWIVYPGPLGSPATKILFLDTTDSVSTVGSTVWNSTAPTSSVFSVGTDTNLNASGATYVNYLFTTCAGVSKVGSYTGTATTQQINCGFSAGARFVLIKRTDSTGDWYLYDSARGIVAGNDPYILNIAAAEVTTTDYVDTYAAGFELSSTAPAALNASGGTYIFLAIA